MYSNLDSQQILSVVDVAKEAVRRAAGPVMRSFTASGLAANYKQDGSLVTEADAASDQIIREVLARYFPDDHVLSEEHHDELGRLQQDRVWIVDPLDGTTQFVAGDENFDIFLAFVLHGEPLVGVTCHPPTGQLLWAATGHGAWIEQAGSRNPCVLPRLERGDRVRLATTRHPGFESTLAVLNRATEQIATQRPLLLPGGFRVRDFTTSDTPYTAFVGPGHGLGSGVTYSGCEWDVAAADVIVREAGGAVTDLHGDRLQYNKADPRNLDGIVATIDTLVHIRILAALKPELRPMDRRH